MRRRKNPLFPLQKGEGAKNKEGENKAPVIKKEGPMKAPGKGEARHQPPGQAQKLCSCAAAQQTPMGAHRSERGKREKEGAREAEGEGERGGNGSERKFEIRQATNNP